MKLIIGFITYGETAARYLPYFLNSLKEQKLEDANIIALDNNENADNENIRILNKYGIEYERAGGNIGFARGYNKLIRKAVELQAEYFLALNCDMILNTDAIEKMVNALDEDKKLSSVCPKIMKWNFGDRRGDTNAAHANENKREKTNIIDSCGIREVSALRFSDLGQGEEDRGQCGGGEILGPSGAAAMYRISALKKVVEGENYFDELMFMYKEDCDLAYRLKLAGYTSICVCDAVIYHDRTAAAHKLSDIHVALNRKNKSRRVKEWGFLNQHIIFIKYWRLQTWRQKIEIIWYAFRMFIYICVFEQYLLYQYFKLIEIKKKIYKYDEKIYEKTNN